MLNGLNINDDLSSVHFADCEMKAIGCPGAWVLRSVNLRGLEFEDQILSVLGSALDFPAYYGSNLDAFNECLRDLKDWLPASGYALVVEGAEDLWGRKTWFMGKLTEIWLDAAQMWRTEGVQFKLIFRVERN